MVFRVPMCGRFRRPILLRAGPNDRKFEGDHPAIAVGAKRSGDFLKLPGGTAENSFGSCGCCFEQCFQWGNEFQTFFKNLLVSPSGGINVFKSCGMIGLKNDEWTNE